MAKTYTHRYVVAPARAMVSPFPIDMLRYDRSFPESATDVDKIHETIIYYADENAPCFMTSFKKPNYYHIHLIHEGPRNWYPTDGRWASFDWELIRHEII